MNGVPPHLQTQGAHKTTFDTEIVTNPCTDDDAPGDIEEFGTTPSSPSPAPESEDSAPTEETVNESASTDSGDDEVVTLNEEEDDDDICAGVNCVDQDETDAIPDDEKIAEIETNSNAGRSGLGGCSTVLSVNKIKSEHWDDRDTSTAPDSLFDGDLDTYYSVNRESTDFVLELAAEEEVHGVSIGFYMKTADEERIQTFDVAVRAADESEYTTIISRKESSGAMGDVQYFEFTSPVKAQYIKVESHGNSINK